MTVRKLLRISQVFLLFLVPFLKRDAYNIMYYKKKWLKQTKLGLVWLLFGCYFQTAEPKKKPCLSDSAVKGIIQPTSRPVKGAEGNNTPVQTPTFRPVSQTEPRARNGSRYVSQCLCTISKIKSFLSPKDLEKVIHAFISSRLHNCNSLYTGISHSSLSRLQLVQNACNRKRDHISPILASLHWLPVRLYRRLLNPLFHRQASQVV